MLYQFSLDNKTWKKLGSIKSQTYGMFKQTYGIFEINNICYVVDTYGITTIPPDNKFYKYPSNKQNGLYETCKFEDQILFFNDEGKGNLFNSINTRWSGTNIKTETIRFCCSLLLEQSLHRRRK